jgi:hypothetical protein
LQQFGGLKSRWRQLHPEMQTLQTFQRVIREQMNVKLRAKGRGSGDEQTVGTMKLEDGPTCIFLMAANSPSV